MLLVIGAAALLIALGLGIAFWYPVDPQEIRRLRTIAQLTECEAEIERIEALGVSSLSDWKCKTRSLTRLRKMRRRLKNRISELS